MGLEGKHKKQMQVIDMLLADKSNEFRATVFELCRQMDWPDDEPGFLVGVATNQLQELLRRYPDQLTEAMKLATATANGEWKRIQAQLKLSVAECRQTAEQIDGRLADAQRLIEGQLTRVETLLEEQCENMQLSMQVELNDVVEFCNRERKEMAEQAHALAAEQKGVIETHTKDLIAQGIVANQRRSEAQVNEIVSAVRRKHYVEVGVYAILAAFLFMSTGWMAAWLMRGVAKDNSAWGDIERWNQNHLQACVQEKKTTCNFHIQVPQE